MIYAHPSITAAQAEQVASDAGMELSRTACGNFSLEQKRERAIAYLRSRNIYVLDQGARAPNWRGLPPEIAS